MSLDKPGPLAPLTGKQIVKLGKRLREAAEPDPADLAMLGEVLLPYDRALMVTSVQLKSIGLDATTRLKTSGTIIDKLRRERTIDLKHIHDLAGARIVRPMTLDQQDEVAARIVALFPGSELLDRRKDPSSGYRAVHVIAHVEGCPVEIQLRTHYQDTWAQTMEYLGDLWGRAIRYGGEPDDPDSRDRATEGPTRRELVQRIKRLGGELHELAQLENALEALRSRGADPTRIGELEAKIHKAFETQKAAYDALRQIL